MDKRQEKIAIARYLEVRTGNPGQQVYGNLIEGMLAACDAVLEDAQKPASEEVIETEIAVEHKRLRETKVYQAAAEQDGDVVKEMVSVYADVTKKPELVKQYGDMSATAGMTAALAQALRGMVSLDEIEYLRKCASGEEHIAQDDTEGMAYIDQYCQAILRKYARLTAKSVPTKQDRVEKIMTKWAQGDGDLHTNAAEIVALESEGKQ